MTDRFDAQLRQHLLGTADERPIEGQVTSIVEQVAVTGQRHPVSARLTWRPVGIGPFPSAAVRFGLVAAALVAALVAAMALGVGSPSRSTVFEGIWTTTDPADGSTMNLYVGGGGTPTIRFEDLFATGAACVADEVKIFRADGTGQITGTRLEATFPDGGGCGLDSVSMAGTYVHDSDADTLLDQGGLIWTRVRGRDGPVTTIPPGPSPTQGVSFEGTWTATDPGDDSTLTLVVGAGIAPVVQFQDDLATGGACNADEVKVLRADGVGEITGNRLVATYPDGGGCGSIMVPIGGVYEYDADKDTMLDQDDVTWSRVSAGIEPPPTLRPAPSPRVGPTAAPVCIDLADGGTYSAPAGGTETAPGGPISLIATIPATPAVPWQGRLAHFVLSASCQDIASITFHASTATSVVRHLVHARRPRHHQL